MVREEKGLSQNKLAKLSGVYQSKLSRIERCLDECNDSRLESIEIILCEDIWKIFMEKDYEKDYTIKKTKMVTGPMHGNSEFNSKKIKEIRQMRRDGVPVREIARMFACTRQNIYNIVNRRTYKNVE